MCRPFKISPEITSKISSLLRVGNYVETAAACCGISKETIYRWLRDGARALQLKEIEDLISDGSTPNWNQVERALSEHYPERKERKYIVAVVEFSLAVDRAQAEAEARDMIVIDKAAQGHDVERVVEKYERIGDEVRLIERTVTHERLTDWRASAWRQERRNSKRWGRREAIEHSGPDGQPIQTQTAQVNIYIPDNGRDHDANS